MNEHTFVQSVTRQLKKHPSLFTWKINDQYAGGVPDSFIEGSEKDLWIEYKYLKTIPARETTLVDLTKTKYLSMNQQNWLKRREGKRKDTAVVLGTPVGAILLWGDSYKKPLNKNQILDNAISVKELSEVIVRFCDGIS